MGWYDEKAIANYKEALVDFKLHSAVSSEVIEKYRTLVPLELIEIWKEYGFGTFKNGLFKIINPDEYKEVLNDAYDNPKIKGKEGLLIPVFATGMGDIITWQQSNPFKSSARRFGHYNFANRICDFKGDALPIFLYWHTRLDKEFRKTQYSEAVEKYGTIAFDECFGYVPLLSLGGSESVENLQKVKIREHIAIIAQMSGKLNWGKHSSTLSSRGNSPRQ